MKGSGLDRAVFKGLRDRLKKVSDDLEDELEKQLEAQLEEELASGMGQEAPERPPSEAADEGTEAPETQEPGPARPDEPVPPEAPPVEPDAEAADPETETTDPETEAVPRPREAASPEGIGQETTDEADERPDAPVEPPQEETEAPDAPTRPATSDPEAAPPTPEAKKDPAPITGRRHLSEEEVQARLERELGEAVETQREVEQAVGTGGGRFSINEDVLEDILWELEVALLESDVALPVIEAIKEGVKEQLLSMTLARGSPHEIVEKVLRTAIKRVLNVGAMDFDAWIRARLDDGKRPVVVMFVGVNGTGKTTSIARIAYRLQQAGISSVLAAGDTFRAGAIEQLAQHGDKLGVRVVKHKQGADPAAVAYDAVEHAKARHKDVVLLDTAGRMQTNRNLMDEMEKVRRVAKPDLVVFVGDSLAGNDAVEQARRFDEVVDIDGAILTKTDVDAKGGAALSVAYTINKPLLFIGVGQDYGDLETFDAEKMVDRLFGDEA